ncbi:MAG: hypothetical protein GWM90_08925 [Gemmatimonadetes bacterium]|nr:hypothetical protein [Gemmatimonadota bacterium]NIQ54017.1 hypothetical protein [Gemmatimonadota bacterium]NIU74201.1 hypothetical protein [Gammaproteobacteria bacterium]NIX44232.1 hypothetical protein [Gemmatimonadota bacterium]NIY08455.1 hypothetical protein [Gemmatimonadota bacterium]
MRPRTRSPITAGVLAGVLLSAAGAPGAAAQEASPCPYAQCALRIEGSLVVRGAEPTIVASLREFRLDRIHLSGPIPDSALTHFREFERLADSAAPWFLAKDVLYWTDAAATAYFLGSLLFGGRDKAARIAFPVSLLASLGEEITGDKAEAKMEAAEVELARGVWWYNRELPRD